MDTHSTEQSVSERQRCLAVVQGLYACLARGDLPGYLQRIAPDVILAWPGMPGAGSPAAGIAGRMQAIAFFTATTTCGTQRVPVQISLDSVPGFDLFPGVPAEVTIHIRT